MEGEASVCVWIEDEASVCVWMEDEASVCVCGWRVRRRSVWMEGEEEEECAS